MRGRSAALVAAALAVAAVVPAAARAEAIGEAELRSLAASARTDERARERLRGIDSVDGRPVAVGAIVAGARPDEIAARVELALASARAAGAAGSGAAARGRAREVLSDRRFTGTAVPRPFRGVLRWLGDRLEPVARAIDTVVKALPGGPALGYALLALLVLGLAALFTLTAIRRGAGRSGLGGRGARGPRAEDPAALERAADEAERAGQWERAVRLRFRAGLLRLDAGEVIAYRPSLTTGEVSRALGSSAFSELGRDFDAIAYGGRPARAEDAEAARDRWRTVLAEAVPRG